MREKVEKALDSIRPYLKADGGDVQLVEITDSTVKVRLEGACGGCPMSTITLKNAVERAIKQEVPEISTVVAV
jgi:Fe-S cluster biogenesis protein NfuA